MGPLRWPGPSWVSHAGLLEWICPVPRPEQDCTAVRLASSHNQIIVTVIAGAQSSELTAGGDSGASVPSMASTQLHSRSRAVYFQPAQLERFRWQWLAHSPSVCRIGSFGARNEALYSSAHFALQRAGICRLNVCADHLMIKQP